MSSTKTNPVMGLTEKWDTDALIEVVDRAGIAGVPKDIRIRNGAVPGTRGTSKRVMWTFIPGEMAEDGIPSIFLSPLNRSDAEVVGCIYYALTTKSPKGLGLKSTNGNWSPMQIASDLGPRPHSTLTPNAIKKQNTYLMRAICPVCTRQNPIRVTEKTLSAAWPLCNGNATHPVVYLNVESGTNETGFTRVVPKFSCDYDAGRDVYKPL